MVFLLGCSFKSECRPCYVQGKIFDCDEKFAVVFGCHRVHSIIGKDVADLIPSVTVCDGSCASTQVHLHCMTF